MELNFNHFVIKTQPGMEDDPVRAGFLMHHTDRWVGAYMYMYMYIDLCRYRPVWNVKVYICMDAPVWSDNDDKRR